MQSPDSGSMGVTVNLPSLGFGAASQCVAVTPDAKYDAGVKVMIPGGQTNIDASASNRPTET
jgi:hypothetical protein